MQAVTSVLTDDSQNLVSLFPHARTVMVTAVLQQPDQAAAGMIFSA